MIIAWLNETPGVTRQSQKPLVERAYEMARSGKFAGLREIRTALKAEKYSAVEIERHLAGSSLRKALVALCEAGAPLLEPYA